MELVQMRALNIYKKKLKKYTEYPNKQEYTTHPLLQYECYFHLLFKWYKTNQMTQNSPVDNSTVSTGLPGITDKIGQTIVCPKFPFLLRIA